MKSLDLEKPFDQSHAINKKIAELTKEVSFLHVQELDHEHHLRTIVDFYENDCLVKAQEVKIKIHDVQKNALKSLNFEKFISGFEKVKAKHLLEIQDLTQIANKASAEFAEKNKNNKLQEKINCQKEYIFDLKRKILAIEKTFEKLKKGFENKLSEANLNANTSQEIIFNYKLKLDQSNETIKKMQVEIEKLNKLHLEELQIVKTERDDVFRKCREKLSNPFEIRDLESALKKKKDENNELLSNFEQLTEKNKLLEIEFKNINNTLEEFKNKSFELTFKNEQLQSELNSLKKLEEEESANNEFMKNIIKSLKSQNEDQNKILLQNEKIIENQKVEIKELELAIADEKIQLKNPGKNQVEMITAIITDADVIRQMDILKASEENLKKSESRKAQKIILLQKIIGEIESKNGLYIKEVIKYREENRIAVQEILALRNKKNENESIIQGLRKTEMGLKRDLTDLNHEIDNKNEIISKNKEIISSLDRKSKFAESKFEHIKHEHELLLIEMDGLKNKRFYEKINEKMLTEMEKEREKNRLICLETKIKKLPEWTFVFEKIFNIDNSRKISNELNADRIYQLTNKTKKMKIFLLFEDLSQKLNTSEVRVQTIVKKVIKFKNQMCLYFEELRCFSGKVNGQSENYKLNDDQTKMHNSSEYPELKIGDTTFLDDFSKLVKIPQGHSKKDGLQTVLYELRKNIASLTHENQNLVEKLENKRHKIKALKLNGNVDLKTREKENKLAINFLEEKFAKLEKNFIKEMTTLKNEYEAKIDKIKKEKLESETVFNKKMNEAVVMHSQQEARTKAIHDEGLLKAKNDFTSKLQANLSTLKMSHMKEISNMKADFNYQTSNLKCEKENLIKHFITESKALKDQISEKNDQVNLFVLKSESKLRENEIYQKKMKALEEKIKAMEETKINEKETEQLNIGQILETKEQNLKERYEQYKTQIEEQVQNSINNLEIRFKQFVEMNKKVNIQNKFEIEEIRKLFQKKMPRVEDIREIHRLENVQKECEKKKMVWQNNMDHLQLELLNREQNYNQIFNVNPLIGIFDPINSTNETGIKLNVQEKENNSVSRIPVKSINPKKIEEVVSNFSLKRFKKKNLFKMLLDNTSPV